MSLQKIHSLRKKIDLVDDQLLTLLRQRTQLCRDIAVLKHLSGGELIYQPDREQDILARLCQKNTDHFPTLSNTSLQAIFEVIFQESRQLQQNILTPHKKIDDSSIDL
jgi:chorismate mutase